MNLPNDPTQSISILDGLIATYVQLVEAGEVPNRQDLIDRNPDLADALRDFFANFDRMDRVASPLRMADVTSDPGSGMAFPTTVRYFGDFELLEEIAHGGMGIVYKARQTSLNRIVALKMVLAGSFASAREVQRFRSEAEAAANLDHPHIVPIYEVGEQDGEQYFSMKLIEGGSLADLPRGKPRAEVVSLLEVVRAVYHAHQHGVLHRDLKPSNVLVDTQGRLYVTDFGLAKRLSEANPSNTQTGQVIGTPRYMSPEQANARKDLTVASDIYSLGVILYERLTGCTPFSGDNVLTLLRQVRDQEPPRPSVHLSHINRDLETIILKCLDKDPTRRYGTAELLAEDLENWLAGRPIQARPVSQSEKAWRWCKRNPALAAVSSLAAFAFIAASVAVVGYGLEAKARAQSESGKLRVAEKARKEALNARETLEETLLRGYLRPLNSLADGSESGKFLSDSEIVALRELSENRAPRLGFRFLQTATRDSRSLRQLRARSEPSLIAALGLDPVMIKRARGYIGVRLNDAKLTNDERADLAIIGLELMSEPGPEVDRYLETLEQANRSDPSAATNTDEIWFNSGIVINAKEVRFNHLENALERIVPRPLFRLAARSNWSSFLDVLAPRVAPTEVMDALVDAVGRIDRSSPREIYGIDELLFYTIERMLDRLTSSQARLYTINSLHVIDSARDRLSPKFEHDGFAGMGEVSWSDATATLIRRLDPAEAKPLSEKFNRKSLRLAATKNFFDEPVPDILYIPKEESASFVARMAERTKNENGLEALSPQVIGIDIGVESRISDSHSRLVIALISKLDRNEASELCRPAVRTLVKRLERTGDAIARSSLAIWLSAFASGLEPLEADRFCLPALERLVNDLRNQVKHEDRYNLLQGLPALNSRVDRVVSISLLDSLAKDWFKNVEKETDYTKVNDLSEDIMRILPFLSDTVADWIAEGLVRILARSHSDRASPSDGYDFSEGIRGPETSAILFRATEHMLGDLLMIGEEPRKRAWLIHMLGVFASKMDRSTAITICLPAAQLVSEQIVKDKNSIDALNLTKSLVRLGRRIEPDTANRLYEQAASSITLKMKREGDPIRQLDLAGALATLVVAKPREMEFDGSSEAFEILVQACSQRYQRRPRPNDEGTLDTRFQITRNAIDSDRYRELDGRSNLIENAVVTMAGRVDPTRAAESCWKTFELVQDSAFADFYQLSSLRPILLSLKTISARLPRPEADRVCDTIVRRWLHARISRPSTEKPNRLTDNTGEVRLVDFEVISLLPYLHPFKARTLALVLASEECHYNWTIDMQLLTILIDSSPILDGTSRNLGYVLGAGAMEAPLLHFLSTHATPRLTEAELVELLKQPLCLGKKRRAVLDALGLIHGRRFVNHFDYVDFAVERKLPVDLTSPPKRFEPITSVEQILGPAPTR